MPLGNTLWPTAIHSGSYKMALIVAYSYVAPLDCEAPALANNDKGFA